MSATLEFNFDQIVGLAKQLSPEERTRLVQELNESGGKTSPEPPDWQDAGMVRFVVSTGNPIFTPEEFETFRQNGERLLASIDWEQARKNREELLRHSLECPVATEEEIEMQDYVRKSIELWTI